MKIRIQHSLGLNKGGAGRTKSDPVSSDGGEAPAKDVYAAARVAMVEEQLMGPGRDISDPSVLAAVREVPRHDFLPHDLRPSAYEDCALPIGYEQTISQPFVVAFMTQALALRGDERVLEIGTGSGYQAAVLSRVAAEIYSVELIEALAHRAEGVLRRLGYNNVHIKIGDGYAGWPDHAPYDAVIVTCAPDRVPQTLIDQLRDGGRMIIPVGERAEQQLFLMSKNQGKIEETAVLPVRFVPMVKPL